MVPFVWHVLSGMRPSSLSLRWPTECHKPVTAALRPRPQPQAKSEMRPRYNTAGQRCSTNLIAFLQGKASAPRAASQPHPYYSSPLSRLFFFLQIKQHTMRTTTHAYSLRPNAKGRRGRQSAGDPDGQVEGSSASTSTSISAFSTGEGHGLADEPGANDPGLATLRMPNAAHNTPVPAQDSERQQRIQEDQRQSHGPTSTSTLSNATYHRRQHRTDMGGSANRQLTESWEEIQAGRQREEARRCAEAVRIRREQIVRGFEQEIRGLRARIVALREECEEQVARARRKWERKREIEQGEVAMVEEDGEMMVGSGSEDADSEMDSQNHQTPTQASLTTENDNNNEQWQHRWPSQRPSHRSCRSENHFSAPVQTGSWELQRQPPHMGEISASSGMAGPSRLQPEAMKDEVRRRPRRSQGRVIQGQPLQRQSAQLVVIPVRDSERRDRDSEMNL